MKLRSEFSVYILVLLVLLQPIKALALTYTNNLVWNTMSHNIAGHAQTNIDYWDPQSGYYCLLYEWDQEYDVEYCAYMMVITYSVKVYARTSNYQSQITWTGADHDYWSAYVSVSGTNPHSGHWGITSDHFLRYDIDDCWYDTGWQGWSCVMGYGEDLYIGDRYTLETVPCMAKNTQPEWDSYALTAASLLPTPRPWESALTMVCTAGGSIPSMAFLHQNDSFAEYYPSGGTTNDPCSSSTYMNTSTNRAGVHTHPFFDNATQYLRGDGCHGDTYAPTQQELTNLNASNANFSGGDISNYRCRVTPLYLRTPTGTAVKKLQGTPGTGLCSYTISQVSP